MRQNRVVLVSFSIVLRRAACVWVGGWACVGGFVCVVCFTCALVVIESASSRMMILNGGHIFPLTCVCVCVCVCVCGWVCIHELEPHRGEVCDDHTGERCAMTEWIYCLPHTKGLATMNIPALINYLSHLLEPIDSTLSTNKPRTY